MDLKNEILLTSDASGQLWNCCVWDFTNGTTFRVFKTGVSASRTLQLLGGEYLISAESTKPLINIWSLFNKGQQEHVKFVCPGKISVMTFTPDAAFCIAAIKENLYIWQVCTGELVTIVKHHYNDIKCLKMSDDGSRLITAAEDNTICIWKMSRLLWPVDHILNKVSPLYSWSDSSLPVTDLYVGRGGRNARVVTVSLDHMCRIYSLRSGDLLMTVIFDVSLTNVVMDPAEFFIFVGGSDGSIFSINLIEPPSSVTSHITGSNSLNNVFIGHSKRITALTTTSDGKFMISGSEDQSVKVWDVISKQCLRNLIHKGAITNVLVIPSLTVFTNTSISVKKHSFFIKAFKHQVAGTENDTEIWHHTANIKMDASLNQVLPDDIQELAKNTSTTTDKFVKNLINEVENLKKANNDLYDEATSKLTI